MAKRKKLHNVNCITEFGIDEVQFRVFLQTDLLREVFQFILFKGLQIPKITIQDLDDKNIYKVFYPADLKVIALDDIAYDKFLDYCIDCGL